MKPKNAILMFALLFAAFGSAKAQSYNSMSGGYNTGYGTVYGSFGMAAASQNMYNTMQMIMQRNILQSTIKNSNGGGSPSTRAATGARSAPAKTASKVAPKYYGRFKPDPTVDTGKTIADALGETPEEKALYKQIIDGTKASFESDASAAGMKNNIAGAFTFFLVATGSIYHDSPEPSDETVKALFDALNQTIDEIPEFAKMSNRDKQGIYNTLIGFAGIPLATYGEGKQMNHEPTIKAARELAGKLIEIVMKTGPDRFRFENGEMKFN